MMEKLARDLDQAIRLGLKAAAVAIGLAAVGLVGVVFAAIYIVLRLAQ